MFQPGTYWMADPVMGTGESKNNSPYVYIEGEITHQSVNGEHAPVEPQKRTVFLYLSEKAFQYTADKLDALGWNGDFASPRLTGENEAGIWVECRHEMYEGKTKERFELPGGGIEHKVPSNDILRKINAMYKQRKGSAPRPAPKKPPSAPAIPEVVDPIPFEATA